MTAVGRAAGDLAVRPLRLLLSALGISIGISALASIVGVSATIEAETLSRLDALHDTLIAQPVQSGGSAGSLPGYGVAMALRQPQVVAAAGVSVLQSTIRRTDLLPPELTRGIQVAAVTGDVVSTLNVPFVIGDAHLLGGTAPSVVLGYGAAKALGTDQLSLGSRLWVGNHWAQLTGVLAPVTLASQVDYMALVSRPFAGRLEAVGAGVSMIFVRVQASSAETVANALPAAIYPEGPQQVSVQRPSLGIVAAARAASSFRSLYLALAGIGLIIAGLGVINTLTISVVERRPTIGLQRALGAPRSSVAAQFVIEGALLGSLGGGVGLLFGWWVTMGIAWSKGTLPVMPLSTVAFGAGAAVLVGVAAGLLAALRAIRLPPSDALRLVP